ncbi:hypothetical protein GYMLUDRAFT_65434 [Collybiopsis luxurians FD-317 M1]|uniref:Uncharacterized protein n=1 Tax=Collybiopsis luxurians FD-317 M1 TaxID=944289 RepID=A0A0D0BKV0_9AGAR|nr:hypothetical protein GYMLUDRAFT_65434 [Collybiopsis luxurians FD-317 M1]
MQEDSSNHQDQVKELTMLTADSLDDLALKMLFVSVQQNNVEVCMRYAIKYAKIDNKNLNTEALVNHGVLWFWHVYDMVSTSMGRWIEVFITRDIFQSMRYLECVT